MDNLQQRLQMALTAARMAVWDASVVNGNIHEGIVVWSPEGAMLLGLEERSLTQPFPISSASSILTTGTACAPTCKNA